MLALAAAAVLLLCGHVTMAGQGPGNGNPPNPIEDFDQNGDGKVSQSEFKGPEDLFSKMDRNSDGYITEDEVPRGGCPQGGPGGGPKP